MASYEADRKGWSKLLPLIQKWIDGEDMECRDYNGKWVPFNGDTLYQARYHELRVAPKTRRQIQYRRSWTHLENDSHGEVTLTAWEGDELKWPKLCCVKWSEVSEKVVATK